MSDATIPVFKWEVAFGSLPGDAAYVWATDISADVAANSFSRGKSTDLDKIDAGTGALTLLDSEGSYDPNYETGPYFPDVRPRVPIRQTAVLAGITYPLCLHYVETWGRVRLGNEISRDVKTVDGFALLATAPLAGLAISSGTTGAHVTAVLDYVGWPAAKRAISTGDATIVAQAFGDTDSTKALPYLQEVASNEAGLLYMDGAGNVVFLDRTDLLGPPFNEIQAHFSDDPADEAFPYSDPTYDFGTDRILNDWTGTRPGGGTPQQSTDTTSIDRYGDSAKQISTLLTTDADVEASMQHYSAYYAEPRERIRSITVNPGEDAACWAALLPLDIGDRVTVTETLPWAKYTNDYLVEKIEFPRGPGSDSGILIRYGLWPTSQAGAPAGLLMDDAVLGLFNTGTLGW